MPDFRKKVVLGADHGGYELKESVKKFLEKERYDIENTGAVAYDKDDDYVDYAEKVARKVGKGGAVGLLFCRSAAGMVIAANKIRGIRAVAAFDKKSAIHSREHNDANVLALSGDRLSEKEAVAIVKAWLSAEFTGEERHKRRIEKIKRLES